MMSQGVYKDEFSLEVFDCFEQKMYPTDVVRLMGGDKKEFEYMYAYWMDLKRAPLKLGMLVEFVVDFEGYERELLEGEVIKINDNSVLVEINCPIKSDSLRLKLQGKVVLSIKDILQVG